MARRLTLDFLKTQTAAGAALGAAATLGLVAANSPWAPDYRAALDTSATLTFGAWTETRTVLDWITNGLMSLFFFVVGLEIKFEVTKGELSSPRRLALPVFAAIGGLIGPALIYLAVNLLPGGERRGWPIPTATDLAVALAVLSAAGRRAPPALRAFLLALAIADALAVTAFIAVLFTDHLRLRPLAEALVALGFLALLSRWRRAPASFYVAGAVALWALTLRSGVSPAVAAVAAAFTVPIRPRREGEEGVLARVRQALLPYVAWGVLPVFAFAASGVPIGGTPLHKVANPVFMGVAIGLLVGKPLGVLGLAALAARLKLARRPTGVSWRDIAAVAALSGVGLTTSLYLGELAFGAGPESTAGKLGVLVASLLSGTAGAALLIRDRRREDVEFVTRRPHRSASATR